MNIEQNIIDFTNRERERLKAIAEVEPGEIIDPVDLYQKTTVDIREDNQKSYPKGSSAAVNMATNAVVNGVGAEGLAKAYRRAKNDSDALKDQGDRRRAEIRRQQYMQEDFLPAVEIVVNSTTPDEVLNSKQALQELDKYVLLEGSGSGYTASYIRQAYGNQLGQVEGRSDPSVRSGVMQINSLLDDGQIRAAYGVASKLKEQIDRGDKSADDVDYELLGRVVAYFS